MKGRAPQPISVSSLEAANWSRGYKWQLNSNRHVIWMLGHEPAGPASTGFHGEKTRHQLELLCCKTKENVPYVRFYFLTRHHRQQEAGQLTQNNYKHLLLRSWKTNTQTSSKETVFSLCEANIQFKNETE